MIHINLNMIFYTRVEYSPTKNNVHKVLYGKTNTHTLIQTAMNSNVYDPDLYHTCACILIQIKRKKGDELNTAMRAKTQMTHIQNRKNTLQPSLLFFRVPSDLRVKFIRIRVPCDLRVKFIRIRVPCDLRVKFIRISTNKCNSH